MFSYATPQPICEIDLFVSCLELAISQMSVVLESSVKPSQGLVFWGAMVFWGGLGGKRQVRVLFCSYSYKKLVTKIFRERMDNIKH